MYIFTMYILTMYIFTMYILSVLNGHVLLRCLLQGSWRTVYRNQNKMFYVQIDTTKRNYIEKVSRNQTPPPSYLINCVFA